MIGEVATLVPAKGKAQELQHDVYVHRRAVADPKIYSSGCTDIQQDQQCKDCIFAFLVWLRTNTRSAKQ